MLILFFITVGATVVALLAGDKFPRRVQIALGVFLLATIPVPVLAFVEHNATTTWHPQGIVACAAQAAMGLFLLKRKPELELVED